MKLLELKTFYLLAAKLCNKRAHSTQWLIMEGVVSDLLERLSSFSEPFVQLRFALKAALPLLANKMLEEEKRLEVVLCAYEESHGRDLFEMVVRELGGADQLLKGLRRVIPATEHADHKAAMQAMTRLDQLAELVDRGEIESLLRSYKFQKFTVGGWKEVRLALS